MRVAIATDAWSPQVNGVVRTLTATVGELERMGHEVLVVSPDRFRSVPCPTYPEIRLALTRTRTVGALLDRFVPDAVHISTEGPLGLAARRYCMVRDRAFTTCFHTQFPDYVQARTGVSANLTWRYVRWFHRPADGVLAATPTLEATLHARGLPRTRRWGRGVDLALFSPDGDRDPVLAALPRPVQLCVGRVAVEKNIAAFLASDHPGSKVVIGDGPAREALQARFPHAHFVGTRHGAALAAAYRTADVLVFPSRTDTFGLVMIEALASGTPVAGFPVAGPVDILDDRVGAMDEDLARAIAVALTRDRAACAERGRSYSWEASTRQFLAALAVAPVGSERLAA